MIVCPKCHTRITGEANFCGVCGYTLNNNVPNNIEGVDQNKKRRDKDAVGLAISGVIAIIAVPILFQFFILFFLFGGLSNNTSRINGMLTIGLIVIVLLIIIPLVYLFRVVTRGRTFKEKIIVIVAIIIAIVALYFIGKLMV